MTEASETQWLREQLGKQLDKSVAQGEAISKQEGIVEDLQQRVTRMETWLVGILIALSLNLVTALVGVVVAWVRTGQS
jgi:hypothetical protein